jgi:hypothetical protein
MTIKWIRPSGAAIETNEEAGTIAFAEDQGWKRAGSVKKTVAKKIKETLKSEF